MPGGIKGTPRILKDKRARRLSQLYASKFEELLSGDGLKINSDGNLDVDDTVYVPYVGATADVDLGLFGLKAADLIINDGGLATGDVRFESLNNANMFFLDASADVIGIGVADPDTTLEIYKVGTQLKLSGGPADYATFAVAADGALTITTVDVDAAEADILLAPDGNVGIGLTDPTYKLSIGSTDGSDQVGIYHDNSDAYIFSTDGNINFDSESGYCSFAGSVGIGTTTPNNTFQVLGLISFDDPARNVFLGTNVFSNDDGVENIGIGFEAGKFNDTTGAGAEGDLNTYIGYRAGYGGSGTNNTGYWNVGIGAESLWNNTSGYRNMAIGSFAMNENLGGYSNVAIGTYALEKNTTGRWNVGIGENAGQNNTTGHYNLNIGTFAGLGSSGSSHEEDIFIGYKAGESITTGNGNTAIGMLAQRYNRSGHSNTVIGRYAGVGKSTNSYSNNTLIGVFSGYKIETGGNNVFIGYKSGYNQTTLANRLIIDNRVQSSVANEITNCLIYGIMDATPANQSLRINGEILGSDGAKIGDGGTTNYLSIGTTGNLGLAGSAVVETNMPFADAKFLVFDKASGNGIKVDTATPTFGWEDLLGRVTSVNQGATKPTHTTYRDNVLEFQFAAGDEDYFEFHIPHDYVGGTDIHLHVHWSHTGALVTGGTITFNAEQTYAKGHNQAAFPATVNGDFTGTASTTQYQHIISETQLSASSPSGLQLDTDDLEVDGIIIMKLQMKTNSITVSGGGVPDPFIHYIDIHYQSTGIGTKDKAPDFYA